MFLYPILSLPNIFSFFQDQFAFRPTGSTTASLIFLIHNITSLLQHNQHVHVISFDFSKAFDSVRHHSLIQKISKFPIPDFLYNWLVSFFNDRSHCTKIGGIISSVLGINASVVQGSGLGPISFVFNASDLHPLNPANKICKYADDFYLIVPSSHSHTIPAELENIAIWAKNNNLKLNQSKSHEMIVRRPRAGSSTNPPATTHGIKRVREMVVLGVTLTDTLSFRSHVDRIVARTAQTSYALRLLRSHGLGAPQLFDVARATLVAQLTYASPAWTGFINCEDEARLQGVLKKLQRSGFLPPNFQTFKEICEAADAQLFSSIIHNDDHVLHQLLPPVKTHTHNLRKRAHDFVIPRCDDSLMRKNFIIRLISANSF
jgi:hypothetical protein